MTSAFLVLLMLAAAVLGLSAFLFTVVWIADILQSRASARRIEKSRKRWGEAQQRGRKCKCGRQMFHCDGWNCPSCPPESSDT